MQRSLHYAFMEVKDDDALARRAGGSDLQEQMSAHGRGHGGDMATCGQGNIHVAEGFGWFPVLAAGCPRRFRIRFGFHGRRSDIGAVRLIV